MNKTLAGLFWFFIGCAAGALALRLAQGGPARAVVPASATNAAAARGLDTVRERAGRGSASWWDMDAPTPEVPPSAQRAPEPVRVSTGAPPDTATDASRDDRAEETPEARQVRFASWWTNQATQARASFVSNALLTEAEAVRFDVLMAAMNVRLQERLDPVIERYQQGWRPTPEDRARLMNEVSTIVVGAYDEMDRNMPEDWREAATNSNLSVTQFVDPRYFPFMRGLRGWDGRSRGGPPPPR